VGSISNIGPPGKLFPTNNTVQTGCNWQLAIANCEDDIPAAPSPMQLGVAPALQYVPVFVRGSIRRSNRPVTRAGKRRGKPRPPGRYHVPRQ